MPQKPPGIPMDVWLASPAGQMAMAATAGMGPIPAALAPAGRPQPPPAPIAPEKSPFQGLSDFAHDVGPGRFGDVSTVPERLGQMGASRFDPRVAGPAPVPLDLRWTTPAEPPPDPLESRVDSARPSRVVMGALGVEQQPPEALRPAGSGGVSRSGPSRPGALGRILGDLREADEQQQQLAEQAAAPYQEPTQTAEGKLVDPEGPGSRAALVDEFQALAGKADKSDAELQRMSVIGDMLKADTAEARVAEQLAVETERAEQIADLNRQAQEAREQAMQRIEMQTQRLADAQQRLAEAKIDPDRLLGSAGAKTAAAIGVALGAMGAALAGTPNFAMQMISEAIDRDIRAQEVNLQNLGTAARNEADLLGEFRQIFRDEDVAREAARVTMHKAFDRKLKALNLEYAPQETRDRIAALAAANEAAQAQALHKMQQGVYDNTLKSLQLQTSVAAQRDASSARWAGVRAAQSKATQGKPLPFGALKELGQTKSALKGIDKLAQDTEAMIEGRWSPVTSAINSIAPWATDAKSFEDAGDVWVQVVGKSLEGRMTDEDREFMRGLIPTSGDSATRARKKLDSLREYVITKFAGPLEVYEDAGYDVAPLKMIQTGKPVRYTQ